MSGGSEQVSGGSERANGRASGPVLTSGFLVILAHSAAKKGGSEYPPKEKEKTTADDKYWKTKNHQQPLFSLTHTQTSASEAKSQRTPAFIRTWRAYVLIVVVVIVIVILVVTSVSTFL